MTSASKKKKIKNFTSVGFLVGLQIFPSKFVSSGGKKKNWSLFDFRLKRPLPIGFWCSWWENAGDALTSSSLVFDGVTPPPPYTDWLLVLFRFADDTQSLRTSKNASMILCSPMHGEKRRTYTSKNRRKPGKTNTSFAANFIHLFGVGSRVFIQPRLP